MKPERRRVWRRRLVRMLIAVVALRILLALLLPWIVGRVGSALGLAVEFRAVSLSLHRLELHFDDLVARDADDPDAPPLLRVQQIDLDASTWQLLHGNVSIVDAAIAGAHVHLQRRADGTLRLPRAFAGADDPTQPAPAASDEPIRFDLPVAIESARVHDARLVFEDLAAAPPHTREFVVDVDGTDLGRPDRTGAISLRAQEPARATAAWLRAEITATAERCDATVRGAVRGLAPASLPMPAAMLPAWRDVHALGVDLTAALHAQRDEGTPRQAAMTGELHVAATADGAPLLTLDADGASTPRAPGATTVPFSLRVTGADLVGELAVADGRADVDEGHAAIAAKVTCRALTLRRLEPWLAGLGVTLPRDGLDATASLDADVVLATGTPSASANLHDVVVGSGDDRVACERIEVRELRAVDGGVTIDSVAIVGPDVGLRRRGDGALVIGGVAFTPPRRPVVTTPPPAVEPTNAPAWPLFALHSLDWRGIAVAFTDEALPTPATVRIGEGTVHGTDLVLGREHAPGQVTATFMVPDALGGARADCRLRPSPTELSAEIRLSANDVTCRAFAPWLRPAGIEPALDNGRLQGALAARVALADGVAIDAQLLDVRLEDRGEALVSVRGIEGKGMRLRADVVDLGAWTLADAFALVRRTDAGTTAAGFLLPAAPATAAAGAGASASRTTTAAAVPAPPAPKAADLRRTHGPVQVRGAVLRWTDARGDRVRNLTVGVGAEVAADDGSGAPVACDATARIEGIAEALRLRGELTRSATAIRVVADLTGTGLRGAGMAPFLPDHVRCTIDDGNLNGHFEASVTDAAPLAVTFAARDLRCRDGDVELAAIDSLTIDAPVVNAEQVHLRRIAMSGARAVIARTPNGIAVPGFHIAPPPAPTPTPPPGPPASDMQPPPVPALRIDDLDFAVDRVVWRDRSAGEGEPVVASMRLRLAAPWSMASDPADSPPLRLACTGAVVPLCRQFGVDVELAPFEVRPTLDLGIRAEGIDTTKLTAVSPRFAPRLAGIVSDARFDASVHGALDLHRRDVRRFDLSRPFGAELLVENLALRAGDQEPLLAVDLVTIAARAIDPVAGDLLLRDFEIEGPRLRVDRGPAGLDVLGVRLLPAPSDVVPPPSTDTPPPAAPAASTAAAEFAVERCRVQGLAVDFVDTTTQPVTRLPVRDGDLVVQNLSSKAIAEARPIAFTFSASGGDVELERRVLRSSVVAGFLGSAAEAIAGAKDEHTMERRPLFEDARVTGQIVLHPVPAGQVRTLVRSLELPALRPLAKTSGVELADGVFDLDVNADLRGDAGVHVSSRTVFTWLSLTEPPGGPISTYLRLPAPLDTLLFLLRNDADEHVVPVSIDLSHEGMSGAGLAGAATSALGRVLADAVKSAAFRTAGAVTGAVGLGGGPAPLPSATLSFPIGEVAPAATALDAVVAALAGDPDLGVLLTHDLGGGDLRRATELANPPAEVVADALAEMRGDRAALVERHHRAADELAALHAAGRAQDAVAAQHALAALDERLGDLEAAIDDAVRMLAGESPRVRARRAREAIIALAERRLDTVRAMLVARLGADAAARIEWRRPRAVQAESTPDGSRVIATVRRSAPR